MSLRDRLASYLVALGFRWRAAWIRRLGARLMSQAYREAWTARVKRWAKRRGHV